MRKSLKVCAKVGCSKATRGKFCEKHKGEIKEIRRNVDAKRGNSNQRGYTYQWAKTSRAFRDANPFCAKCLAEKGWYVEAEVVDHIIPHRNDMALFWDDDNWQSLCKQCHDSKTAKENGGFGRKIK